MIEFESVSKTYRDGTHAVEDLSLTVPSDKISVIVGPSGCGKTTTLRMVNRMLEPTSGRITWDGAPLRSKRRTALRRQMGYVIQSGGLFPHRTVLENIGTVPGLLGWSKAKIRQRSIELLDNVGLDRHLGQRYPAELSGGQQQRVGVARALAADPMVMLMDEPFSAVDPVVRSELHEFFLGLQRELSKTIILITHDIDEAIKLGDQVAILRIGGRLAQVGAPQQLLDEPADAFVEGFIGRDRGYRLLSFVPADGLQLDVVDLVREADRGRVGEPTLVVDEQARPVGWVDPARPQRRLPLGSTFSTESDTLRAALDAALTSPYGLGVAVEADTGRYAGVASAQSILEQLEHVRAQGPDSSSGPGSQVRDRPPHRDGQGSADLRAAAPAGSDDDDHREDDHRKDGAAPVPDERDAHAHDEGDARLGAGGQLVAGALPAGALDGAIPVDVPEDPLDAEVPPRSVADGSAVAAQPGQDDASGGAAPEGDAPEGDAPEGDASEGDAPEGDAPEGDAPEGDASGGGAKT